MAKASGGTRYVRPTSHTRTENYLVYKRELSLPDIDPSQSYFSKKKGGCVLAMKGRKYDPSEAEAAKAMADDGLLVVLTPEGDVKFRTGKSKKGGYTYADGLVNGYTYEQKTVNPQGDSNKRLVNSIDSALQHARDKSAKIPLIYDRHGKFHREHIEAGLHQFESNSSYRFNAILVVDRNGKVYEHLHNK